MLKKFKNLRKSTRVFLLILPLALIIATGILYFSSQRYLAESACGCGIPPENADGNFDYATKQAFFNDQPVKSLMAELPSAPPSEGEILGTANEEKWIEIDLSDQKLYAHNGDRIDYEFFVSSGKWAPTPTGEFRIWIKLRYTLMHGGNKALHTYYYLPNVPYTQYFNKGVGLHGTYWHNNFGHPMSHGCVNMATPDAEKLFYWTSPPIQQGGNSAHPTQENPGTRVVVHE